MVVGRLLDLRGQIDIALLGNVKSMAVGTAKNVLVKTKSLPTMWTSEKLVAIAKTWVFGHVKYFLF